MEFVLMGFRQDENIRRFAFQGIAEDKTRSDFTVGVDLRTIAKYSIPLQELPVICRRLLEGSPNEVDMHALVLSEANMFEYASHRAEERREAEQRKGHHKPQPNKSPAKGWHY